MKRVLAKRKGAPTVPLDISELQSAMRVLYTLGDAALASSKRALKLGDLERFKEAGATFATARRIIARVMDMEDKYLTGERSAAGGRARAAQLKTKGIITGHEVRARYKGFADFPKHNRVKLTARALGISVDTVREHLKKVGFTP